MEILRVKFSLMVLLLAGGLVSLYMVYKSLEETSLDLYSRAEALFHTAVALDKQIREGEISAYRKIYIADEGGEAGRQEPQTITIRSADTLLAFENTKEFQEKLRQEKEFVIDQIYLLHHNPLRLARLDSLYQSALSQAGLPLAQGIVYETKQGKTYSRADSGFYRRAHALAEYVVGVNREIVLQAYVQFPPGYVFRQAWPAFAVCLIVWAVCLGLGINLYGEKKRLAFGVAPLPPASSCLVGIAEDLLWDESNGILFYKEQRIELVNYRRRLFVVLLGHREEYLSSEELRGLVWEDRLSGKDALAQTVKRLRDDLWCIPSIRIDTVRGKGYCLRTKSAAGVEGARLPG